MVQENETKEKSSEKYQKVEKREMITEVNLRNYVNMKKRLVNRQSTSNFILVYYSVMLIIFSLVNKFFPGEFNNNFLEFSSIVVSVILLAFSLVNQNARYTERILSLDTSINKLKSIKRTYNSENLDKQIEHYNSVVDNTEMREDKDFYRTVMSLCKEYGIGRFTRLKHITVTDDMVNIKKYLSELNRSRILLNIGLDYLLQLFIVLIPIIVLFGSFVMQ